MQSRGCGPAAVLVVLSFVTASCADELVPPPAETPFEMVASGRSSTLWDIIPEPMGFRLQVRLAEPDLEAPRSGSASRTCRRKPTGCTICAVYWAVWRLGSRAPSRLVARREKLLAAATASPETQQQALAKFTAALPPALKDVQTCGAAEEAVRDALSWLDDSR